MYFPPKIVYMWVRVQRSSSDHPSEKHGDAPLPVAYVVGNQSTKAGSERTFEACAGGEKTPVATPLGINVAALSARELSSKGNAIYIYDQNTK